MLSSPALKGDAVRISKEGGEVAKAARRSTIPLWNAYHFFTLYANADGIKAEYDRGSGELLDKYILARLAEFVRLAGGAMDAYDAAGLCAEAERFLDVLDNWYIRLSRERFWGTGVPAASQQAAFNTLYVVLCDLSRVLAPVLPFPSDHIHRALCGPSAHLADWPAPGPADEKLVSDMELARSICSLVHTMRDEKGIPSRQPLSELSIFLGRPLGDELLAIIKSESNVKKTALAGLAGGADFVKSELYLITPVLGKKYGKALADIQRAAKAEPKQWNIVHRDGGPVCLIAGVELSSDEFELKFTTIDPDYAVTGDGRAVAQLDTTITPELRQEGLARDFIRAVQEERKRLGLNVADRIRLTYTGIDLGPWRGEAAKAVLAVETLSGPGPASVPDSGISFKVEKA